MKAINLIVLATALLIATVAFADRQPDRNLWIAIDDGTENGGLFVNLDGEELAGGADLFEVTELRTLQGVNSSYQMGVVTIYSDNELDETTKEKIEAVLSLSGHTGVVVFVGRNRISSMEINGTD